jgi:hypothetical protein
MASDLRLRINLDADKARLRILGIKLRGAFKDD